MRFTGRRVRVMIIIGASAALLLVMMRSRDTTETVEPGAEKQAEAPEARSQLIEEFKLEGFDADGNRAWWLTGDKAHIDLDGDIFIEENIELKVRDKTLIESDKVLWQSDRKRFITNQPVRVTHEGALITGRGALGKLEEDMVQINQDIRMELDRGTILTCRGPVKIYNKTNLITYYRDVIVTDPEGRVLADEIDIMFNRGRLKIEEVIARKNVMIEREGNVTFSEKAIYNTVSQSVRLVGEAEIRAKSVPVGSYIGE